MHISFSQLFLLLHSLLSDPEHLSSKSPLSKALLALQESSLPGCAVYDTVLWRQWLGWGGGIGTERENLMPNLREEFVGFCR